MKKIRSLTVVKKGEHPLDQSAFPRAAVDAFQALGYRTVEQVASLVSLVGPQKVDNYLSQYLKLSQQGAASTRRLTFTAGARGGSGAGLPAPKVTDMIRSTRVAKLSRHGATRRVSLGARLKDPVTAVMPSLNESLNPSGAVAARPSYIGFHQEMPAIRNQNPRGTCVAFATVAALERAIYLSSAGRTPLSEQFCYWLAKRADGVPEEEGTWLEDAVPAVQTAGCCSGATWPYQPMKIEGNESQGPPPETARSEALTNRPRAVFALSCQHLDAIKKELRDGYAVALSVVYFPDAWEPDRIWDSGDLTLPLPDQTSDGGHAICLVGYLDSPEDGDVGGGRFIFRNSWGLDFAKSSIRFGAGYGSIPYSYVTTYGKEAYSIH